MSFTRFHDDPFRISQQVEDSSFQGKYFLNTPGQGSELPFIEDPHIRIQQWGANLMKNSINVESDLKGLTRKMNRDLMKQNNHHQFSVKTNSNTYPTIKPFVDETRTTHPAWLYRNVEIPRWETPWLNPLENTEKKFVDNVNTRILQKDNFVPTIQKPFFT